MEGEGTGLCLGGEHTGKHHLVLERPDISYGCGGISGLFYVIGRMFHGIKIDPFCCLSEGLT